MPKQSYPEATCGALIFNQKKQIFLMKSHKWRGKYVIPGGHVELGETIKDALKREIKEETGLDIFAIEFICYQDFIFDNGFWKKKHFIFFDFACKTKSTKVKLNSEAQEYVWVSVKDALQLPIESYTKNVIKKYLTLGKQILNGANMDIDLTSSPKNINWKQNKCPWNKIENTTKHKCAVKNTSICPYFCGIKYLDKVLCCYPNKNPNK